MVIRGALIFSGEHNEHHSYFLRFKTGIGAQLFAYGRTTVWVQANDGEQPFLPLLHLGFSLRELIRALTRTNTKRCKYTERLHGYNCNHVTILLLRILLHVCKILNINILL